MEDGDLFEDLLGEADLLQSTPVVSLFDEDADRDTPYTNHQDISSQDASIGMEECPNAAVIQKIEQVMEDITDGLLNERDHVSLTLKIRSPNDHGGRGDMEAPTRRLSFPGKTADEAWRFAVVMRILGLMHEALRNDVVISKRDIYYRDPALFSSQAYVDRYVDDIAYTFGVTRSALNVAAAAKGLVAGAVGFRRRDGSLVNAANDREGTLVPSLKDVLSVNMAAVKWILVIEKEATFRSIAASTFWDTASAHGLLLTGKGYPDLASRALLRLLSTSSPQNGFSSPPVYGLADYDPDGIAILSTYKNGSKALAHETDDHCVPQLQWLGLRSHHLNIVEAIPHAAQGLLKLTPRDRRKAVKKLEQEGFSSSQDCRSLRIELQTMLMLNMKAELQLLDHVPHGMVDFINARLPGS